ncbi:MAG TPA: hypothetical protein PKI62_01415 [bacterium]|nr:hypothetical protein [bacterium]HPR86723.1 hypothetical protein [bacterium]
MRHLTWLVLLLTAALAAAAGTPGSDMRPPTARECEFYARMLTGISKAMPPGPMTWLKEEETPLTPPERIAAAAAWHPLQVHYAITWSNAQRKKLAALDEKRTLRSLGKAEEERARAEAQKKLDQLVVEKEEADKGHDLTAAQVLDREIGNLMVEIHQIKEFAEDPQKEQEAVELRDTVLRISVEVNHFSLPLPQTVRAESLTTPTAPALRFLDGFDSEGRWQEGAIAVFLGPGWRHTQGATAVMETSEPVGLPSAQAYALIVRVQGDIDRVRSFVRAMDWAALESLIFK